MKKIVKEIEEDFSIIGSDFTYPTQFVINEQDLSIINDGEWVELNTGNIFVQKFNNGPIEVNVDGLIYNSVMEYGDSSEENFSNCVGKYKGRLAFYLVGVDKKTIQEGICLGEGMRSYEQFPNEEVIVIENINDYDIESKRIGLKCMTSKKGNVVKEIFCATNKYATKGITNYEDEVREYLLSQKTR